MKIKDRTKVSRFKDRLKEAMTICNMKQTDLIRLTGIPKSAMSQYVSGAFEPKNERLSLIAQALNVNQQWLAGYDVPMRRIQFSDSPYALQVFDLLATLPIDAQIAIAAQVEDISKNMRMCNTPPLNLQLFATNSPEFTEHEQKMIQAYRLQSEIQPAVDRLLGIEENNKKIVYKVAESDDNRPDKYLPMKTSRWNEMESTPKTDEDLL